MASRQLSLFDCFEINTNKKRRTERSNTEPEPRSDVEKPEESHENKKSRQFNDVFVENPNTSTTIASSTFSTLCYDHSEDSRSESFANQIFQTLKFNNTPATTIGNKQRSFNSDWYKQYHWLEYSCGRNAAFCYPCRLFNTGSGSGRVGRQWETFIKHGFCDWKHAMGKDGIIPRHGRCSSHKDAMVSWQQFQKNKEYNASVADRLLAGRTQLVAKN